MGGISPFTAMSPRSKTSGRGSKAKYSNKQKRQAQHIEEGYKRRGVSEREAERRAWATANKTYGGGTRGGSGHAPKRKKS